MSYDFLKYGGKASISHKCFYDSYVGFKADFSIHGDVDKWEYYVNIDTYGCWNGFLFGTVNSNFGYIGRSETFLPVPAESFYFIRIVMKIDLTDRTESQETPTLGAVKWRTLTNTIWNTDKQQSFTLIPDGEWHTYNVSLASAQYWQGDINDLRIYPIYNDGRSGDEFFIKEIEIFSHNTGKCVKTSCSYYDNYVPNCPGTGTRGYCKSAPLATVVSNGSNFDFAVDMLYSIEDGVNDVLYVNINNYGSECIKFDAVNQLTGTQMAVVLESEISKIDVGGYAECEVEYTALGEFVIYSGVYNYDSTVILSDSPLSRTLGFFTSEGQSSFSIESGTPPVNGFKPVSSFKLKSHQLYNLLDNSEESDFYFNPYRPSIEGGRSDWLYSGLGGAADQASTSQAIPSRYYAQIENAGNTVVDFSHPFNASGKISKLYVAVTLDTTLYRGDNDSNRKITQLSDAKVVFFRPTREGNLRVLPFSVPIENRNFSGNRLYSAIQEYVEIDCDIIVNKGDLIGIYNANVYIGRSALNNEIDALYYSFTGLPTGEITIRQPSGDGSSGLLVYGRSEESQTKLVVDIDLGKRINIENINVDGGIKENVVEYNIARCLDIDWEVDLFGEDHTTSYTLDSGGLQYNRFFNRPNVCYGIDKLSDGIKTASAGLASAGFSIENNTHHSSYEAASGKQDGGRGVILHDPKYFCVNGDSEWLDVYLHVGTNIYNQRVSNDFERDPIAFTIIFPGNREKLLYRSIIYFKEVDNFRSFAQSLYRGPTYVNGDADDSRFDLIKNRADGVGTPWVRVKLNDFEYYPEDVIGWADIDLSLGQNPCVGHEIKNYTGGSSFTVVNMDQWQQALSNDWTILDFEWPQERACGYRFYCDYHRSTKICEFELYSILEGATSTFNSAVDVRYSSYGDMWWLSESKVTPNGMQSFIGDTPRYIELTIKPITEIRCSNMEIDISYEDVFTGDKGCQYIHLPTEAKTGQENTTSIVNFKNVYGDSYDLYVDIADNISADRSTIFYSKLNDLESITNPIIGADAYYKKQADYALLNTQKNVAINCPVYALNSITDGADVWYSHDKEYSWKYWGKLTDGESVDFSNLPDGSITTINLPVLTRSKWWKITFLDPRIVTNVTEIQLYYEDEEIFNVNFYHHENQDVYTTPNTDRAPHLSNNIVDGSYYVMKGDYTIGFEFDSIRSFDRVVIYHTFKEMYENSHNIAGIDISTALCIHGEGNNFATDIEDVSYYEHNTQVIGNGIYYDTGYTDINYSFTEDFSTCDYVSDLFNKDVIDDNIWVDLVNASVDNGRLEITNSGTVGSVTTVHVFSGDFDVNVSLHVIDEEDNEGWGSYLTVVDSTNTQLARVGRTYTTDHGHSFMAQSYDVGGWSEVGFATTIDTDNLKLRLRRVGDTLTYFGYDQTSVWEDLGNSVVSGTEQVKFMLSSDLTPSAVGVTTSSFDFFITTLDFDGWFMGIDYGSSYTSVSGVCPTVSGGYALQYEVRGNKNRSEDITGKLPQVFITQSKPIDQDFEFTMDFVINMTEFLDVNGNSSNTDGISVGLLGFHTHNSYYLTTSWLPFFTGAQVIFKRDDVGIAIKSDHHDGTSSYTWPDNSSSYISFDSTASIYFCRFTHDGVGNYRIVIWTDSIDGSTQVIDHSLYCTHDWEVDKIGVGAASNYSSYGTYFWSYSPASYSRGWISDVSFTSSKRSYNSKIGTSSIRFNGVSGEKLLIDWDNATNCNSVREVFNVSNKNFTFEFFIKFSSLPTIDGEYIELASCWDENQEFSNGSTIHTDSSWAFILQRSGSTYKWRFYANIGNKVTRILNCTYYPDLYRWYHFYLGRGPSLSSGWCFLKNGHSLANAYVNGTGSFMGTFIRKEQDVVIGRNLDGWMRQIRISIDSISGGDRIGGYSNIYRALSKALPISPYERYYTFSIYNSVDNVGYGKHMDVDALFDNSHSYHEPLSTWSDTYESYFAIDFGKRHAIDIMRSFPVDSAYNFNKSYRVLYSNKETIDPEEAFTLTAEERILSTDFTAMDYDYPSNWTKVDDISTVSYILDNQFYQSVTNANSSVSSIAVLNPYFSEDFDIQIDYDLIAGHLDSNTWMCGFEIQDVDKANNAVKFERGYSSGNSYKLLVKDNSSSWNTVASVNRNDSSKTIRLVRNTTDFMAYIKDTTDSSDNFELLFYYTMTGGFGKIIQLKLFVSVNEDTYPDIQVWWNNFIVNLAIPVFGSYSDARWMRVRLLNGDGATRTIKKVTVYPDVTVKSTMAGQHNNQWTSIGSAITSYSEHDNIALGCTVSGSSEVGVMETYKLTDGIIDDGEINSCWGGEEGLPQWVTIYLNDLTDIYRIKIYHGYDTERSDTIVQDYTIQTSIDNITFTTIFNITGNTLFERTHDLANAVSAKYIKINIINYTATEKFVWKNDVEGFQFWAGPVLREVEVFEYYGFTIINSEDTPVIAIDLQDRFFIEDTTFVGIDTEDTTDDWISNDVKLAYSTSALSEPHKVNFSSWDDDVSYTKWLILKNNNATKYPTSNDVAKYLKHVVVVASTDEQGASPNPVEYPWMWRSSVSQLNHDYSKVVDGFTIDRSLKISYPSSTAVDHVRFIEGDHFGYVDSATWRDGLGIFLYIDNLSNLDLTYGYIYLGGLDASPQNNPITYKWNFTTLSGSLQSGWNEFILPLSKADAIDYTENRNYDDPRRPYTLKWGKIGIMYRGVGNELQMNIYGCWLSKNHFESGCYKDFGLYLQNHDILKINVSELDLHSGTVDFWIRPDWNLDGIDSYGDFKFRALFHIANVANDVFGAMVTNNGLEIYFGSLTERLNVLVVKNVIRDAIDNLMHFGFVFSNDGSSIGSDKSTVRFYINNTLVGKSNTTWIVNDNKYFNFVFGGQGLLGPKMRVNERITSSVDGVVGRLKIYNYCKTDFRDSIDDITTTSEKKLINPSQLIEISKDNLTFYKIGDSELPLVYEDVADDVTIPVYTRVVLPDHNSLTGFEKRTARIIGSWEIGV